MNQSAALTVALGAALLAFAPGVAAQSPGLTYLAPASCPDEQAFRRAVGELVRGARIDSMTAQVNIEQSEKEWLATVTTPNGQRRLTGSTCAEVEQAVAVILALALSPNDSEREVNAAPSSSANPAEASPGTPITSEVARELPAAELSRPESSEQLPRKTSGQAQLHPAAIPARRAKVAARASNPLRVGAVVGLLGDLGTLPGAAVGGAAGVRLSTLERAFADLSVLALLPKSAVTAGAGRSGGDFAWWSARLRACGTPPTVSALLGCVGFEAGRLTGTGFGVDHSLSAHASWLAPSIGLVLRFPRSYALHAELGVDLVIPLLRPGFELDSLGLVYRPSAASGRAFLGIGWR